MLRIQICAFVVCAASVSLAGVEYEVIQIGHLAGYEGGGSANAINSHGQVVGYSAAPGIVRGWFWTEGGGMVEMSNNGGDVSRSIASDINDLGIVTGDATINGTRQAFRWQNGSAVAGAGTLQGDGAVGTGINTAGTIVGYDFLGNLASAAKWPAAQVGSFLPSYGNQERSGAYAINEAGRASGSATLAGTRRATLFNTDNTLLDLHGLMPVGTTLSQAEDINNADWATGFAIDGALNERGFIYNSDLGMQMIDPAAGFDDLRLLAMNDGSGAVGFSWSGSDVDTFRASIWQNGIGTRDLNTLIDPNSGWVLQEARDINNDGWIVGYGTFMGVSTTYLAKPVPEPGTMVLVAGGVLGLVRRRRSA